MPDWYDDNILNNLRDNPTHSTTLKPGDDIQWNCKQRYYRIFNENNSNDVHQFGLNHNLPITEFDDLEPHEKIAIHLTKNPRGIQRIDLNNVNILLQFFNNTQD